MVRINDDQQNSPPPALKPYGAELNNLMLRFFSSVDSGSYTTDAKIQCLTAMNDLIAIKLTELSSDSGN